MCKIQDMHLTVFENSVYQKQKLIRNWDGPTCHGLQCINNKNINGRLVYHIIYASYTDLYDYDEQWSIDTEWLKIR